MPILLESGDGVRFTVELDVASCSKTIKTMIDDLGIDVSNSRHEVIPLLAVSGNTLKQVLQWFKHHRNDSWLSLLDKWTHELQTFSNGASVMAMIAGYPYWRTSNGHSSLVRTKLRRLRSMNVPVGRTKLIVIESQCSVFQVLQWCKRHRNDSWLPLLENFKRASISGPNRAESTSVDECAGGKNPIDEWDAEFLGLLPKRELLDLILAANYLDIEELLTVALKFKANEITGQNKDSIRQIMNIHNDFTPDQEEQIRKEIDEGV